MRLRSSCLILCLFGFSSLLAASEGPDFHQLLSELRCPQCEGQSLAESSSPVAESLRRQIGEMLREGQSPVQIKAYLVRRYGEQVLMVPSSSSHRLLLWGLPLLLLGTGIVLLYRNRIFSFQSRPL